MALRKLWCRFQDGAKKYELHNWMKGIPLSRFQDAINRHTLAWAEGDRSEDHLGAVLWNASCAAWTEHEIEQGRLPEALNDLPFRPQRNHTDRSRRPHVR